MHEYRYIVYLLHFATKVRGKTHYIGSTQIKLFQERMRAHAMGYGAKLTTLAFERTTDVRIARTWTTDDRSLERRLKSNGHFDKLCPICCGAHSIEEMRTIKPAPADQAKGAGFKAVGFPSTQANRKREANAAARLDPSPPSLPGSGRK